MLTAGVHALSAEYLRGLRALCDETGVLLVFDEIVTGFGRLGSWFAAEQADVWPDILCVGKGLSERLRPALGRPAHARRSAGRSGAMPPTALQYQAGHTFAGNPVSAACGLAVIRYVEEHGVLENVARARRRARGAAARDRRLATRSPARCAAAGCSTASTSSIRTTGGPLAADQPVGTAVQRAARRRGLLVRASPHNATLAPPLILTAAEVAEIAEIFEESVAEVNEQVVSGEGVKLDVAFGL